MTSDDGGLTWEDPVRVSVSSPHGPNRLANGDLAYLGKTVAPGELGQVMNTGSIGLVRSSDNGRTWTAQSSVPLPDGLDVECFHEPHVVELGRRTPARPDSLRSEPPRLRQPPARPDRLPDVPDDFQRWREDLEQGGDHGNSTAPRLTCYDIRAVRPRHDLWLPRAALRGSGDAQPRRRRHLASTTMSSATTGLISDLGYPSSVELTDGSILTVYYQRPRSVEDKCALLWSRWRLPV